MSFLSALKTDPDIRKIFGKRELAIIEKQLVGVSLTQSEKNRLSRDIRKKLQAVRTLCRFENEFELKKGSRSKSEIGETKEIILQSRFSPRIERIILFGTAAENKLSLRSDIDICVEFSHISKTEAMQFRKEILGKTLPRIDIQVFNILPPQVQQEINQKGRILFEQTHSK